MTCIIRELPDILTDDDHDPTACYVEALFHVARADSLLAQALRIGHLRPATVAGLIADARAQLTFALSVNE